MAPSQARRLYPAERVDYSEFYQLLLKRRDELLRRDERDRAQIEQYQQTNGGAPGDEADVSVIDTSSDYFLRLADRERQELLDIRRALEKLHRGTYGICEDCQGQISIERLRSLPHVRFCIDCQAGAEGRDRVSRLNPRPKL